jgi:peroxiredoxin
MASPSTRQGESGVIGSTARDFSFELAGKPARLSELRGRVVVLNFWATWCPPCIEEMPSLERLHQQISASGGMVLGISVDENAEKYQRFLQDYQITFPTARDPSQKIASGYGTFKYPETYIIDRSGHIARKVIGPQQWDRQETVAYLKQLAAQ